MPRIMAGTNPYGYGLQPQVQANMAQAFDFFSNVPARMGYGTPSLAESATYELDRLSFNYWLLITLYRNHWITRRIVDTPAQDMIRAWPKLTSDIEPKDLTRIDRVIRRTQTKATLLRAQKWARLFGGSGALIAIDGQEDHLDKPLDLDSVGVGDYKGLIPFDRWTGITPYGQICTDINRPGDFNKPEFYQVNAPDSESFLVHGSRILRFSGPEVPTPEYEAQTYWGISAIEPAYEEIRKRDNMSWNILSLTFRACILGMKFPQLAQALSGVGMNQQSLMKFQQSMTALNHLLSNQSLVPLPENGSIEAVNYTFTGLSDVYQQFQLDISGATQIPVTRLWGRTISGLGQANDADERIYEERIATDQDVELRPQLEKLYPVLCMSELGAVPDDLDLNFPSVRVLDEKEKSELAKDVADTVAVYVNLGIMSPRTAGREVKQSSDVTGIGTNFTDEDIAKLPDEVQQMGEQPGAGGGDPLAALAGGGEEGESEPGKGGGNAKKEPAEGEEDDQRLSQMQKLFGPKHAEKRAMAAVARAADAVSKCSVCHHVANVDKDGKILGHAFRGIGTCPGVGKLPARTADVRPKCPHCGSTDYGLMPPDFETAKCHKCGKNWEHGIIPGINDPKGRARDYSVDPLDEEDEEEPPQPIARAGDADDPGVTEYNVHGLTCVIETPKGHIRSGKGWRVRLPYDYGFLEGFEGADGDSLDACVGPNPESRWVYLIDQRHLPPKTGYDETKCMLGFNTLGEALTAYDKGHHRSREVIMDFTPMSIEDFKHWLATANLKKPAGTVTV